MTWCGMVPFALEWCICHARVARSSRILEYGALFFGNLGDVLNPARARSQADDLPSIDTEYTISAVATNFLGSVSNPATMTIVKRSIPPPIISMMLPSPPVFSQDVAEIMGFATFSSCSLYKGDVLFLWTVATSDTFEESSIIPKLNSTSGKLTIPAGTLSPGTEYYIRLVAVLAGAGESSEVRTLVIEQSPLIARIAGGNARLASLTASATVDASGSFDPDFCKPAVTVGELQEPCLDSALQYAWSCTVPETESVCRRAADYVALPLGNGATSTLELSLLPKTLTSIVVTVTVYKNMRSSSTSVTIHLTKDPVLIVSTNVLKVSPERLLVQALVQATSRYACKWNMTGGQIPDNVDYSKQPYADIEFVRTGWEASTLSLLLHSPAAALIVTPGNTYTVVLSCTSAENVRGLASYSWRIPLPPWGGTCSISSTTIEALAEELAISCSTWSAEDLPIRYSFGIGVAHSVPDVRREVSYTVPGNSLSSCGLCERE
jgi:hypothetical protein